MVGEPSLQDVMNVVASGLATGQITQNISKRTNGSGPAAPTQPTLTEFDAFIALDPLLADLQKQYLDAKGQRLQATREFGGDDAMTEMAIYNEDSAWCAMQTRYMELRSDRALMRQAQDMMQHSAEEERVEQQRIKEKEALKVFMQLQIYQRMHEQHAHSNTGWWFLFFILSMQTQEKFRAYPSYQFNRLAA